MAAFDSLSTPIAASDPLGELAWSKTKHIEAMNELFFAQAGMTAAARGNQDSFKRKAGVPIIIYEELESKAGSEIRIPMRRQLTSTPRSAYGTIQNYGVVSMLGLEEPLNYYDMAIKLGLIKHASGTDAPDFYSHYTSIDMEDDTRDALKDWIVTTHEEAIVDCYYETYPYFIQQQLSVTAVANTNTIYAGGVQAQAALSPTHIFNANEAMRMHSFGRVKKLNPIKIGGSNCLVVLADTFECTDLKRDPVYRELKDALPRGMDNPIAAGAMGIYQQLCIWEYERVRVATSGAQAANTGRIILTGADAVGVVYGSPPRIVERAETDYDDRWGRAIRQVWGAALSRFQESDNSATTQQSSAEWRVWRESETFA